MSRLRHRDQLLSLKYSTIEACFSVPMLNLTLPSFPFVLAFAVKVLGWEAAAVGLAASLPHLCNFAQAPILAFLTRRFSNYEIMGLTFVFSAAPWALAGYLALLEEPQRNVVFAGMLAVATLANSISSVTWSAAISELVPERISGRFFGRRNLIFGTWTLVVVMMAGYLVDREGDALVTFGWVFGIAGIARLVGLFFLSRMKFPPQVMTKQQRPLELKDFGSVLSNRSYIGLSLFIGCWGLLLNASMPFYTVYLVDRLDMGVANVVWFTTVASFGGLLTLKGWGLLMDRFGSRSVLHVCALVWAVTALTMWTFASPAWTWHLYLGYFIVGAVTAGFQLSQFNLMLRLAPAQQRSAYVAVFLALTSLLTAAGPILGGWLLSVLPPEIGRVLGLRLTNFHLLFAISGVGFLVLANVVERLKEQDQPLGDVWREMKRMRTFNPMLSVLAAGELLLTPRGLVALGQRSWRTARRQVKALGEVGEEIVVGGTQAVRKSLTPPDK